MIRDMDYSPLEKSFLHFSRDTIEYMKSNLSNGDVEKIKYKEVEYNDRGWDFVEVEKYPYYQGLPPEWMAELGVKEATRHYIKRHNDELNVAYELHLHELIAPLLAAVHQKQSLFLSDEELLKSYKTHRSYWTDKQRHEFHYIPLINFNSDSDVEVTDQLSIKHISDKLKSKFHILYHSSPEEYDLTSWDIFESNFMLDYKNLWSVGEKKTDGRKNLLPIISALRLHDTGDVGTKSRMVVSSAPKPTLFGPSGGPVLEYYTPRHGKIYNLKASNVPKIIETYNFLSAIIDSNKYKLLRTPLNRFHISYTRTSLVDKIIDYSIVLESLLLSNDKTELLYRMIMRASWLLRELFIPLQTKKILQAFYEMRSSIVHNGSTIDELLKNKKIKNYLNNFYGDLTKENINECIDNLVKSVLLSYIYKLTYLNCVHEVNIEIDKGITSW